jgi:hypothetical protein
MTQLMNFETSLLSYLGSALTGRSGTSLLLGMLSPLLVIGYSLLVIDYSSIVFGVRWTEDFLFH